MPQSILETVRAVRTVMPEELALMVRISATDWVDDGWTIEDSIEASRRMMALGVDLVDCSTGGASRNANIPVEPNYQVTFATQIREATGMPTGAVGLITEPKQADDIIREGKADLVLMGRELLRDPYWPHRAWVELQPESDPVIAREYAWALRETRRRR